MSNKANAVQQNNALRAALLATAPRMRKNLGTFTANALGGTTRVKLLNAGIITGLSLAITVPVTIGTAAATPSAKAPYNAIQRVRVSDYDGTDRVNLSGFQLFIWNCVRNRAPFGYNNSGPIYDANGSTEKSGIITNPNVPTAVAAANVTFLIDVPVAYDPENDLRGSILAQTAVGEAYLTIDWTNSLYTNNDVESLYSGAGTTTVALGAAGFQAQVFQEYLLPQAVGGQIPLPMLDLMTVYEFVGAVRTSDNVAVNTEKLISYPNYRTVIGAYVNYVQGGALNANDISTFRLIANGNNVLQDWTLFTRQIEQRNFTFGDLAKGTYYFLHRDKPIETALFGNVQLGVTPSTVGAGANFEIGFESFYTKGAALPGVQQGS